MRVIWYRHWIKSTGIPAIQVDQVTSVPTVIYMRRDILSQTRRLLGSTNTRWLQEGYRSPEAIQPVRQGTCLRTLLPTHALDSSNFSL